MGNIPAGGQGAARGFLWRGWLSPWHPPGSPGLGKSWSDHKMFTEGAALLSGAGGALSHGERLVQPSGAWLRSPLLFHHIMGLQHQAQSPGEEQRCLRGQGDDLTAEGGCAGHLGTLFTLG